MIVKIFPTPFDVAEKCATEMTDMISNSVRKFKPFTVAFSGGSTPELLFELLGEKYTESVSWRYVHIFWADERCVPPENSESNFGLAKRKLLDRIEIPALNIHRITGENDPEKEALRYSEEVSLHTRKRDRLPLFDLVLLGLGEDGHTASIFPGHPELLDSEKICEVALHPVTMQNRITLTGRVLNNADYVTFLVTGKNKAEIVNKIVKKNLSSLNYPASHIVPVYGRLSWFLDQEAGKLI